jgi:acyl-CoA synthetase (AMP-forming)/AMP-acid ligase II
LQKETAGPGARVCVLCDQDALFPVALLSVWRSGRVAVPLCKAHPPKVMEYYLHDSQADLVVASRAFVEKVSCNSQTP